MSRFIGAVQRFAASIGPWWLGNGNLGALKEALALTLDDELETLAQGVRLSQPLRCDRSALPVIAKDRGITLYPAESEASKRYRLSHWLDLHRTRGTHLGEMRHIQPYFLPSVPRIRIVHQDGTGSTATWHTLNPDGSYDIYRKSPTNWNWDAHPAKWSRFWVIIYLPDGYLKSSAWDGGAEWDDGSVYRGIDTQKALDIVGLAQEWKAAYSRLAGVILATDPYSFDPTSSAIFDSSGWTSMPVGNWGTPIDTSSGVHTRLPGAIFLYENAE